jgi:hypothetical protein
MEEVWDKFMMDRDNTTSSPGRATGKGVEGPEIAATGTECDTSTYMAISASVVDAELSGMTIVLSENLLKIHLTAMMLANRHEGRCFRGEKVARCEKKALWKTEGVAMIQA